MLNVAALLEAIINNGDHWTEDDPALEDVTFRFDEFDPRNPKMQILFETLSEDKVWISSTQYRHEQKVKLTIFLKPTHYKESNITTSKQTFLNMKSQVDQILGSNKFILLYISELKTGKGWEDLKGLNVGRGGKDDVWQSSQTVTAIYYIDIPIDPFVFPYIFLS